MKKQHNKLLHIGAWCTIIVFILRCLISWKSIITDISLYDLFGFASESISIALIITSLYDLILWRYNPLEKTPVLSKNYTGVIKSNFDHIEREASIVIKQTLSSVHIALITKESKSNSIVAYIDDVFGETKLIYTYLNTPKAEFRNNSPMHHGTAIISLTNPDVLEGQYYTDRLSDGDMKFTVSSKATYNSQR